LARPPSARTARPAKKSPRTNMTLDCPATETPVGAQTRNRSDCWDASRSVYGKFAMLGQNHRANPPPRHWTAGNNDDIHIRVKAAQDRVAFVRNALDIGDTAVALDERHEHRPLASTMKLPYGRDPGGVFELPVIARRTRGRRTTFLAPYRRNSARRCLVAVTNGRHGRAWSAVMSSSVVRHARQTARRRDAAMSVAAASGASVLSPIRPAGRRRDLGQRRSRHIRTARRRQLRREGTPGQRFTNNHQANNRLWGRAFRTVGDKRVAVHLSRSRSGHPLR
jgi:hypothetical protein